MLFSLKNYSILLKYKLRKAKKLFGELLPNLESIESMTELVLVNIDFSIDYPQVLPPNVIPVGGLQVNRSEKQDQVGTQNIL